MYSRPLASALLLALLAAAIASPASALTRDEEVRVLAAIRRQQQRFLDSVRAVRSRRRTETRVLRSRSGALLETRLGEHEVVHYFYRRPDLRTLSCRVDGAVAPASRCAERWLRLDPHIQIFDRDGERHYEVHVAGIVGLEGRRCYRVDVAPRVRTVRHFAGQMYFAVDDLSLVRMEGGVAHLPFPLRHVYMKLGFRRYAGADVDVAWGYVDVWVRIPLLYQRRIVTRFTAIRHEPVPR